MSPTSHSGVSILGNTKQTLPLKINFTSPFFSNSNALTDLFHHYSISLTYDNTNTLLSNGLIHHLHII